MNEIGTRANDLMLLEKHGFRVPAWKVLATDSNDVEALVRAIEDTSWGKGLMTVSPSPLEEENPDSRMPSVLGVKLSGIPRAVEKVRGSVPDCLLAVVVQELVPAEVSGVAFSCDPLTGDTETVVINSLFGLNEGLRDGKLDADSYRVKGEVVEQHLATKTHQIVAMPRGGYSLRKVAARKSLEPSLTKAQTLEIAKEARRAQRCLGDPQELEWCLCQGRLHFLQARPITALHGELRVWDNSSTRQNFPGATTPLTFSFARHAHEQSFGRFCRTMGVSGKQLRRHRALLKSMLGFFRGRVYYNMNSCYGVLSLLPGYPLTSRFLRDMMGAPRSSKRPPRATASNNPLLDLFHSLKSTAVSLYRWLTLEEESVEFHAALTESVAKVRVEGEDLVANFRELEGRILSLWRVPLMNSYFAMVYQGTLGLLLRRWLPGEPSESLAELLSRAGADKAVEGVEELNRLADTVSQDASLSALFEQGIEHVWVGIAQPQFRDFQARVKLYLARFGDRCQGQLKLETQTLKERPDILLSQIWERVQFPERFPKSEPRRQRNQAEFRVFSKLPTWKRPLVSWLLRNARARLQDLENHAYERARLHGQARRMILVLAAQLVERGGLREPLDIFFLTREEVLAYCEGAGVTEGLQELVELRRAEYDCFQAGVAPPDRFASVGSPRWHGRNPKTETSTTEPSSSFRGKTGTRSCEV